MPPSPLPRVRGLVLAAGAGRRMGGPKALLRKRADGPTLVEDAVVTLLAGGCEGVTVVVGAEADRVADVVDGLSRHGPHVEVVECPDWAQGMGASLRVGLRALADRPDIDAAVVTLVDLPDVGPDVVARLLAPAPPDGHWREELRRAAYGGVPGHPALIGRDHWEAVVAVARGDRGARDHYRTHPHQLVEAGDLATGRDVDLPEDLEALE